MSQGTDTSGLQSKCRYPGSVNLRLRSIVNKLCNQFAATVTIFSLKPIQQVRRSGKFTGKLRPSYWRRRPLVSETLPETKPDIKADIIAVSNILARNLDL